MRPRPMKPHVVNCDAVEEKVLRVVEEVEPVRPPLPNIHSLDGENRIEMAAFIVVTKEMKCDGGDGVGKAAAGGRVAEHTTLKGNSRKTDGLFATEGR